jgi:hypothetical protein
VAVPLYPSIVAVAGAGAVAGVVVNVNGERMKQY